MAEKEIHTVKEEDKKSDQRPPVKKHDIKLLDLAFAMDCTSSMGSFIASAKNNILQIVEKIVASEKSDVRLALVNYRDHPPQDSTFVTEVHDFTPSPKTMKDWLANSSALGGGDIPEAVADGLHDVLKLSWREEATKICVCISDAPPHGLGASGDCFPDGCPAGIDPMVVVNQMAEKGITLYVVGCEPSIAQYKDFFMALAYVTGGQYVPLTKANVLSQVIIGGAQEEMALEQLMDEVNEEVQADLAAGRDIDPEEMSRRVHSKIASKGMRAKQLHRHGFELDCASEKTEVNALSKMGSLAEVKKNFKPNTGAMAFGGGHHMRGMGGAPPPPGALMMMAAPMMGDMGSPEVEEVYELADDMPVTYQQSSRMVQKSMARNKVSKR